MEETLRFGDHPQPDAELIDRIKQQVRLELDSEWLAKTPTPEPSDRAVRSTKQAVADELSQPRTVRFLVYRTAWPAGWGAWAAAALIAICVGSWILSYSQFGRQAADQAPGFAEGDQSVDDDRWAGEPWDDEDYWELMDIAGDLDLLEASFTQAGQPSWWEVDELDLLDEDIDAVLDFPDSSAEAS